MSQEGIPGIPEEDVAELEAVDKTVRGRDRLPFWFDGVTVESAPAAMVLELMRQKRELDAAPTPRDREWSRQFSGVMQSVDVIAEFHRGHRRLHAAGIPLEMSMALQYGSIKKGMEERSPPWNGHPLERWQPFLDELARAYVSFYELPDLELEIPED